MKEVLPLFVFIDACGWEIIKHDPFVASTAPNRRRLTSGFGYSSACVPSIPLARSELDNGRSTPASPGYRPGQALPSAGDGVGHLQVHPKSGVRALQAAARDVADPQSPTRAIGVLNRAVA